MSISLYYSYSQKYMPYTKEKVYNIKEIILFTFYTKKTEGTD